MKEPRRLIGEDERDGGDGKEALFDFHSSQIISIERKKNS